MSENQPTWTDQLPDNLKSNDAFTGFEKLGDMADSYISMKGNVTELEGKLGNSITKLGDNATSEEQIAFHKAIGRPDDISGYELDKINAPENMPYDEGTINAFKEKALSLGLSLGQAKGLHEWYSTGLVDTFNADTAKKQADYDSSVNALKSEWGTDYDKNITITTKAIEEFGSPELKTFLEESGVGNNPKLIQAFYNIGKAMSDDKLIPGSTGGGGELISLVNPTTGRAMFEYPNSPDIK